MDSYRKENTCRSKKHDACIFNCSQKGRTGDTFGKNNSVASKWLLVKRFFANHNIWGAVKIYFSVKFRSYPSFLGSSLVFFQCLAQITTSKPSTCNIKFAYIAVYMHCSFANIWRFFLAGIFFFENRTLYKPIPSMHRIFHLHLPYKSTKCKWI